MVGTPFKGYVIAQVWWFRRAPVPRAQPQPLGRQPWTETLGVTRCWLLWMHGPLGQGAFLLNDASSSKHAA
jgi:hypothetical protein